MARPLRLEHVGEIWHVTARGNARADIVYDDTDRQAFVDVLGRVVTVSRWRLHAWVLMTNHYHPCWRRRSRILHEGCDRSRERNRGARIPRRQRRPARPDLPTVEREVLCAFGASLGVLEGRSRHPARKAFAPLARRVADAPLGAISSGMKLSARGSGTTARSAAELEQKDRRFRRLVAEVEKRLR